MSDSHVSIRFFVFFLPIAVKIIRLFFFFTVKQSVAVIKALPDLFPSPVAHKKLGHASAAMLHILKVRNVCMYFSYYLIIFS